MKKIFFLLVLVLYMNSSKGQSPNEHYFDNQYIEFPGRTDYYNWKVYLVANPLFLNSISQVVYYLDPTFRKTTLILRCAAMAGDSSLLE